VADQCRGVYAVPPRGSVAYYEAKAEHEDSLAQEAWDCWFRHSAARDGYRRIARAQAATEQPQPPATPPKP
jgi:hypothetical protein